MTRFQLNVDDEPVAGALRFGPGAPITAFVTLWTDGDPAEAIAELSRRMTELMASVARFGADQGLDLVPTSRYAWQLG